MPRFRKATFKDCKRMAPHLRREDREEALAALGGTPRAALEKSFRASSHAYTIDHDGEPIAIFGVGPTEDGTGCPWMLGTDGITRHWVWFLRNSPEIIDRLQRHYERMENAVDVRNTVHIRWLKWCGFSFGAVTALGPEGRPFQHFWRHR